MSSTETRETSQGEQREERPLVTFALFAYNQERFIREAVEGAFSQTYEPLEIILSDDCSSDRTFEIMQEMAAAYEGPHSIVVRKSVKNEGTLNHVLGVAHEATGQYMVVAAGDDISLKERVVRIIDFMEKNDFCAASTTAIISDGQPEPERQKYTKSVDTRYEIIFQNKIKRIYGATAAYRVDCLPEYRSDTPRVLTEDFFFELLFYYSGAQVGFLDEPSILYRTHDGNTSVRVDAKTLHQIKDREIKIFRSKLEYARSYSLFLKHICCRKDSSLSTPRLIELSGRIRKKIDFLERRPNWYNMGLLEKICFLPMFIHNDGLILVAPRIFGLKVYALVFRFRYLLLKMLK